MPKSEQLSFRQLREEAGIVLSRSSNRLKLIEAILICLIPLLPNQLLFSVYEIVTARSLLPQWLPLPLFTGLFAGAVILLNLLFTLPLLTGLLEMAAKMERGKFTSLADLFVAFSSGKCYGRALLISLDTGLRIVLFGLLIFGAHRLCFTVLPGGILWGTLFTLLVILAAFVWLLVIARRSMRPFFIFSEECSLRQSRKSARRMSRAAFRNFFHRFFGFLPWILLSFLTVCILLLADVLPRMLIAYFRACRQLRETVISSEETTNE